MPLFPLAGKSSSWTCKSLVGGVNINCTAQKKKLPPTKKTLTVRLNSNRSFDHLGISIDLKTSTGQRITYLGTDLNGAALSSEASVDNLSSDLLEGAIYDYRIKTTGFAVAPNCVLTVDGLSPSSTHLDSGSSFSWEGTGALAKDQTVIQANIRCP